MVKKERVNLEKLEKYIRKEGMIDWSGGPIKLERLGENLEFLLGKMILHGEYKRENVVLHLKRRGNEDGRGEYYATVYASRF